MDAGGETVAVADVPVGWRGACLAWAGLHSLIRLPLNRFLIPLVPPSLSGSSVIPSEKANAIPKRAMGLLASCSQRPRS